MFLTAITNNNGGFDSTDSGSLAGTGLTASSTALVLPRTDGDDVAAYNPATGGKSFATSSAAATAFNTTGHWVAQSASGDQDADNTIPDAPFLTDAQSPLAGVTFSIGALPTLSISDPTVTEGNSGTTILNYTVTASAAAPVGGITFDIATADGTASASSDYVARSLTGQTIPAGGTTYIFQVVVNGDTTVEPNETVLINISNAVNATIAAGQGTGTITNDDAAPVNLVINELDSDTPGTDAAEFVELYDGRRGEHSAGRLHAGLFQRLGRQQRIVFRARPRRPSHQCAGLFRRRQFRRAQCGRHLRRQSAAERLRRGRAVSRQCQRFPQQHGANHDDLIDALVYDTADADDTDLLSALGQSIQIDEAGTGNSATASVGRLPNGSGTFATLATPTPGASNGTVTPTMSIADASITEGNGGTTVLNITVTRSDTTTAFTIDYATAGGTATAGGDYVAKSGTLTFAAGGPATEQISITINGDTTAEPDRRSPSRSAISRTPPAPLPSATSLCEVIMLLSRPARACSRASSAGWEGGRRGPSTKSRIWSPAHLDPKMRP